MSGFWEGADPEYEKWNGWCYSLVLYCAFKCEPRFGDTSRPIHLTYEAGTRQIETTGRNRRECVADAKQAGWRIHGKRAACPQCVKEKDR